MDLMPPQCGTMKLSRRHPPSRIGSKIGKLRQGGVIFFKYDFFSPLFKIHLNFPNKKNNCDIIKKNLYNLVNIFSNSKTMKYFMEGEYDFFEF